jgi:hypothetical protein
MRVNIIATTTNLLWKIYFLQQIYTGVTAKYICDNSTHILQPFISLVTIKHIY